MRQLSLASHRDIVGSPKHSLRLQSVLLLLLATIATALPAVAQSEWQLYGGTSFLWQKTSPYAQQFDLSTIHEFGWQTDITQYPWHWFGATLEGSGFYGRPNIYDPVNKVTYSDLLNVKTYTVMFGPTFAYRRNPRFEPFGHVLLGGINRQYSLTSKAYPTEFFTDNTPSYSQWIFGWTLGGGADVSINRMLAVRGQMDWIPTTFHNFYNDRQNNFRVTVGLVFRFGNTEPAKAQVTPPQPLPTPSSDGVSSIPTVDHQPASAQNNPSAVPLGNSGAFSSAATPIAMNGAPVVRAEGSRISSPNVPAAVAQGSAVLAQRAPGGSGNLQPGGAGATETIPPPAVAAVPQSPPPVMVEFWSRPTGADVEIDGQYVGSTFSTLAIPAGEHTITIRMKDFATWQRTIQLSSGNVRVAAYLEQVRATVTFH